MTETTEQRILAELLVIRRTLAELSEAGKADLTQTDFAKAMNVTVQTVKRWHNEGKIRIRNKRVPYRYLRERLS